MSLRTIRPAAGLVGTARLPGDKSISHRLAILGALAEGTTEMVNYSSGRDCRSTLDCLAALGVRIDQREESEVATVRVEGRGLGGFQAPARELDAGNSGSTLRMLAGALAAHPFESVLTGDESLRRRPMRRVMEPLRQMGASLDARDGDFPPLRIRGAALRSIDYVLPVPSAQVKTAVLLAGLHALGTTSVEEPVRTRDHTEIALEAFGASVTRERRRVSVVGRTPLRAQRFVVPNDLSAAAFLLVAGLLLPKTNLVLPQVSLNPTRTALLDFLLAQGAQIKVFDLETHQGELRANLHVRGGAILKGGVIEGALTVQLIDELPVLAVLGTQTREGLRLRDAAELRVKETDRLAAIARNLSRFGARVEEFPDGLDIPGRQRLRGAAVSSFGDHRIAMAMAVAGLVAEGQTTIDDANCADISFPGFFDVLAALYD
ncbi:MAG TPA: 3-phosphoshikimate 1-carboxyvinyltransferase [Candidatus Xenobia bacterium]|nr:3-phosphoshikimate 1-carboxyvinyltransferase [Candidatus Xenobia bacterium]